MLYEVITKGETMTKSKKAEIIDQLTESFKTANAVVMCDYRGLTVVELEALRNAARTKDVKVQVVKNTLATIALSNANMTGVDIVDTNIFVWGDDAIAACKTVADFAKNNDKFSIRNAYIDSEAADAAKVHRITSYNVCYTKLLRFGFKFLCLNLFYM